MATNQEHSRVASNKERQDRGDGWDTGYCNPYPKELEEEILANINKVSPAFVEGYREGKRQASRAE